MLGTVIAESSPDIVTDLTDASNYADAAAITSKISAQVVDAHNSDSGRRLKAEDL